MKPKPILVAMAAIAVCGVWLGCASRRPPTWSKASPEQRASWYFIADDAYRVSPQYTNDHNSSVDTIVRMRKQKGGD